MAEDDVKQPGVGEMQTSNSPTGNVEEALTVYRLVPGVGGSDSNWDSAPAHGEVIVRARSAADARIVAAESERDFLDIDALPGDGNSTDFASAFRNPRLYSVVEDTSGKHDAHGRRGVIPNG